MEKLMQDLIDVIGFSHQYTLWDYVSMGVTCFATVVSLSLSIIALCQSTKLGKRQNKIAERQNNIALFEMRYQVIYVLNFLLSTVTATVSYVSKDKREPLEVAMKIYLSTNGVYNKKNTYEDISAFYTGMILECGKVDCLFKDEDTKVIMDFLQVFKQYMSDIVRGQQYFESEQKIEKILVNMSNVKIMKKLDKYLKL